MKHLDRHFAFDVPKWLTHCYGLLVTHRVHRGAGSVGGTKPAGGWAVTKPCERVSGRRNRNKEPHQTAPDPGRMVLKCNSCLHFTWGRKTQGEQSLVGYCSAVVSCKVWDRGLDDCLTGEIMVSRASSLSRGLPTFPSVAVPLSQHMTQQVKHPSSCMSKPCMLYKGHQQFSRTSLPLVQ